MESLTVTVVKLLRRHPFGVPYVIACTLGLSLWLGLQ